MIHKLARILVKKLLPFIIEEMGKIEIRFKKESKSIKDPVIKTDFSVGYDLHAYKYSYPNDLSSEYDIPYDGVEVKPGERILVRTGIKIEYPLNVFSFITPRSGMTIKDGALAVLGTIDSDYRNGVGVILINLSDKSLRIKENDRIGQMVFAYALRPELKLTDSELLDPMTRMSGFGSTGIS